MASARREPSARSQVSFPPGLRITSTCGDPVSGSPVCVSLSGVSTLTGVSSAPRAGSAASAACIASSNPASWGFASRRALALSTNPGETGMPSSIRIRCAARSAGTFPYAASSTAAVLTPGPYAMVPACAPGGATAVVTCPQHGQASIGSSHSVTSLLICTSRTCAHDEPAVLAPSRAVPHREHCGGGSALLPEVAVALCERLILSCRFSQIWSPSVVRISGVSHAMVLVYGR